MGERRHWRLNSKLLMEGNGERYGEVAQCDASAQHPQGRLSQFVLAVEVLAEAQ